MPSFLLNSLQIDLYLMFCFKYIKPRAMQSKSQSFDYNIIFLSKKKVEFLYALKPMSRNRRFMRIEKEKNRNLPPGILNDIFSDAT